MLGMQYIDHFGLDNISDQVKDGLRYHGIF